MIRQGIGLAVAIGLQAAAGVVFAQAEGSAIYANNCAVCHDTGVNRAPTRDLFTAMPPERVLNALENGSMLSMAVTLSSEQRRAVSEFLSGRPLGQALPGGPPVEAMCRSSTSEFSVGGPRWTGWGGAATTNVRFQPAESAGISASDVPRLKLKWSFGFPGLIQAFGNPAVIGGRVFVGSQDGKVYSLDARTGCVYWYYEAEAFVRTGISVAEIDTPQGVRAAIFFGDGRANLHALDAATGASLWRMRVDDYPVARVTGSPALHDGRLYVPIASGEEAAGSSPDYECCRFRGSLVAVEATTGQILWKTYTVDQPRPARRNAIGTQLWGPSGVPIWSSPAIDPVRNAVYVTTGNNYSDPTSEMSDAFVAMDLDSGEILWFRQMTKSDAYVAACRLEDRTNCAESDGPDVDFGASPILVTLGNGRRALVAGQKSGVVHALDPDDGGRIIWQVRIGRGGSMGGVQWGSAADQENVYIALSDIGRLPVQHSWATEADPMVGGGMFALRLTDGERVWYTPPAACGERVRCSPAQSAAVTAIPGVAFSGSVDGHLRAYSSVDGEIVWDFDTVRTYETVNGVSGRGGSLDGPGPVVAGGMLFVNSGYPTGGGLPGNVLLAFSVDGD